MNVFTKIFIGIIIMFILKACCVEKIRLSSLEIDFENFEEEEIAELKVIRKDNIDSTDFNFRWTTKNSIEVEIQETSNNYDLYFLDSNASVIDSISKIETIVTNDASNCTNSNYEYEYKFTYNGVETVYSQNHKIEIKKQD